LAYRMVLLSDAQRWRPRVSSTLSAIYYLATWTLVGYHSAKINE
jgi:hypothetical protein